MLNPHLCVKLHPLAFRENIVESGNVRVTVLEDRLFRIEQASDGQFCDEATQVIWYRDHDPVAYSVEGTADRLWIKTKSVQLAVDLKDVLQSEVRFCDGKTAGLNHLDNLKGTYRTLDTNGAHLRICPSVNIYDKEHIPLEDGVCSKSGVAVYDDSGSLLLSPNGRLSQRPGGGKDYYVFAFGDDYPGAVRALYRLCGSVPEIPRWALGTWWSRYWQYTQQEYKNLMDNFADDQIPISVAVIDMDWHYVNIDGEFGIREKGLADDAYGGTDGWTGYTWNPHLFPDHRSLLRELHRRGMHVTLNLHPAEGVRWYEQRYPEMAKQMGMDPASRLRIPFQIQNETFVNAYLDVMHHPLEDEGVDFWWVDWQQGSQTALAGLDPLWALNHYHFLDNQYRSGQGLILSRYCGVGAHRYPVGFSGDIHMDWEFLRYMPYFTATASNIGYTWWSHDIGGHHRGERDEELYLRWLQFGVFSPINRIHCCPAEVTSKEPWTLTAGARALAEKWFRLRHKLIPYLYTYSWLTANTGVPLIAPMYYAWPREKEAYQAQDQYMFGQLLVVPIVSHSEELGMGEVDVWLPEGFWTDIFTGVRYLGGRWVHMLRDSGSIPVLAPGGTCLPLDAGYRNDCALPEEIELQIYCGDGGFTMYERTDKGLAQTIFETRWEAGLQRLIIRNPIESIAKRKYHICFREIKEGRCKILKNGVVIEAETRQNRCFQVLTTVVPGDVVEIQVDYVEADPTMERRRSVLEAFIQLPQDNWYKEKQWEKVSQHPTVEKLDAWISQLDIPEVGRRMLWERLYARVRERKRDI